MVGKNQIKRITSLHQKKYRMQEGLFIAEGVKVITELVAAGLNVEGIFVTESLSFKVNPKLIFEVSEADLKKMSALNTANNCLAVFKIPEQEKVNLEGLVLALDDVRDPGNLGTIIRLCDWFGIRQLLCSEQCVDLYNPKVVQATMGSIARVNVAYVNLEEMLSSTDLPVFGTFMDGENLYEKKVEQNGIIVMGNEANGISQEIEKCCSDRIAIPRFGETQKTESLNVATATAVILGEFRSRQFS